MLIFHNKNSHSHKEAFNTSAGKSHQVNAILPTEQHSYLQAMVIVIEHRLIHPMCFLNQTVHQWQPFCPLQHHCSSCESGIRKATMLHEHTTALSTPEACVKVLLVTNGKNKPWLCRARDVNVFSRELPFVRTNLTSHWTGWETLPQAASFAP